MKPEHDLAARLEALLAQYEALERDALNRENALTTQRDQLVARIAFLDARCAELEKQLREARKC